MYKLGMPIAGIGGWFAIGGVAFEAPTAIKAGLIVMAIGLTIYFGFMPKRSEREEQDRDDEERMD